MAYSGKIPQNVALQGTAFGKIRWRNLIEAGTVAVCIGYPILFKLPLPLKSRIYFGIPIVLPLMIFSLIGINGLTITEFLKIFLEYRKKRDVFTIPNAQAKIRRERNLLIKKREQMELAKKEQKMIEKEKREQQRAADRKSKLLGKRKQERFLQENSEEDTQDMFLETEEAKEDTL